MRSVDFHLKLLQIRNPETSGLKIRTSLFKHVCLNSVEVKFQLLIAQSKAHGPILFRSFIILLVLRDNK